MADAQTAGPPALAFLDQVLYGGDYNPEQWPPEVWAEDVALMQEAGVNLVSVGIFSWAFLEPTEGTFDFAWLRRVMDMLGGAGIGVDLATPTASPPPWLSTRYPDVLPVDERGATYSQGSRQHFCVCSPTYRRFALRIVKRLAAELGGHPAVRLWHVHNEYACHVPRCYCDQHATAFQAWLRERYPTVAALNDAWGTAFWSQRYSRFDEVLPPRMAPTFRNPGHLLDYKRFCNDAYLDEFRAEKELLRAARPDIPVTTNFMGFFEPIDYFAWAGEMDVVSTDNYPFPAGPETAARSALHYDLVRSLNKSAPWFVMEQAPTRVNWHGQNVPKAPGQMRALSYQALARGARGTLFFQWRASRAGAEKYHSGMVPHAGTASPSWEEVKDLGRELPRAAKVGAARVDARAAVLFSWDNWWALEGPAMPAQGLTMTSQLEWACLPLYRRGATFDLCRPDEPLGRYDVVVVPSLYLVTDAQAANLLAYVERGGTVVMSFWSGIVDEHDRVRLGPYGGPLRPLMGCDVVDIAPLPLGESYEVRWADGARTATAFWADVAVPGHGEVLATLSASPWAGSPAVVRARFGSGVSYYVATRLGPDGMSKVYDLVPALAPAPGAAGVGDGAGPALALERTVRREGEKVYEFLVNHSGEATAADLSRPGTDLLTGSRVEGRLELPAWGVAVVERA